MYKAHRKVEKELYLRLDAIAQQAALTIQVKKQKHPPGLCGGSDWKIFTLYDANNNCTAQLCLQGRLPAHDSSKKPIYEKSENHLTAQCYAQNIQQHIEPLFANFGDLAETIERYSRQEQALSQKIGDASKNTILWKLIFSIDFLKPYEQKLAESGRETVYDIYTELKYAQTNENCSKALRELLTITDKDISELVQKIEQQLPEEYLALKKQYEREFSDELS